MSRVAIVAAALGAAIAWAIPSGRGAAAEIPQALSASGVHGGLVIHLGCGDGKRTLQLRAGDGFIIQGLDTSAEKVAQARQQILQSGCYGQVTARECDGRSLPFIDSTVNLVVVDDPFSVPREEMMRVLCPKGALCVAEGGKWKVETKPWPAALDEWTHYQHDPQGTMVGNDQVVGPPRHLQWIGDPKWLRNHDFMSSMHAMVSSGGRVFYIIDEGLRNHVFLPARWTLVARDGFNGAILWKRPLPDWHPSNWPLKSGPGYMPRRLVAVGDRVYVTLGLLAPTSCLDAATGQTVRTYDGTKTTEEIALADGTLFLLVDPDKKPIGYTAATSTYSEINRANTGWAWSKDQPARSIVAVDADSGKLLWKHAAKIAPLTLTVGQKAIYFFDGERMIAVDRKTGAKDWASEEARITYRPATGDPPRAILSDGVLVLCHGTQVSGISTTNGKLLWQGKIPPTGHHNPSDLFVIGGLVWSAHTGAAQQKGTHFIALDLHTGATAKDFVAENIGGFPMHPRCYPSRATQRYIMTAGMGTEFYEVGGNKVDVHDYVRGSCIYGVMPCNGLLYKPPDTCACFYMSKLENLCALAPEGPTPRAARPIPDDQRLQKGPAYGSVQRSNPHDHAAHGAPLPNPSDWPMFRHDAARSGSCASPVPAELKKAWEIKIGGRLTQPVMAGGKTLVASVDTQTVYALDAGTGKTLWKFTAGGRIDSPPTILQGTVLFGSADGCVYCLRADDGALAWRYLVAPEDRQMISYQQPESVWPLNGSVLVHGNTVYALAGRNMFFDGGMRLVRLDRATGKKLSETVLDEIDPQTGKNLQTLIAHKSMPVANADILSCDGKNLYMATRKFDLEGKRVGPEPVAFSAKAEDADRHLFCPTGFLDDLWYHRSYFIYGSNCGEGWAEYSQAQRETPCGRMLVVDDSRAYGFRADGLGNILLPTPTYRLYSADKNIKVSRAAVLEDEGNQKGLKIAKGAEGAKGVKGAKGAKGGKGVKGGGDAIAGPYKVYWQIQSPPLMVNALVRGGKNLFAAGPPHVADESKMLGFLPGADDDINRQLKAQDDAWRGKLGALLWVLAAEDGKKLAEYRLDSPPVFDGMIAAGGRLFISTQDGRVLCMGGSASGPPNTK